VYGISANIEHSYAFEIIPFKRSVTVPKIS